MKATKFAIDRARWACGKSKHSMGNQLLNGSGMCCLGFYALACGLTEDQIRDEGDYEVFIGSIPGDRLILNKLPSDLVTVDRDTCVTATTGLHEKLVEANDAPRITRANREKRIKSLFRSMGVSVRFIGEYPARRGS